MHPVKTTADVVCNIFASMLPCIIDQNRSDAVLEMTARQNADVGCDERLNISISLLPRRLHCILDALLARNDTRVHDREAKASVASLRRFSTLISLDVPVSVALVNSTFFRSFW